MNTRAQSSAASVWKMLLTGTACSGQPRFAASLAADAWAMRADLRDRWEQQAVTALPVLPFAIVRPFTYRYGAKRMATKMHLNTTKVTTRAV
ncbi:MAG: hypothetical protein P4N59_11155 [Negativicutes bacterium]|nr:hypothetical protein [Negativicutes bacterium]